MHLLWDSKFRVTPDVTCSLILFANPILNRHMIIPLKLLFDHSRLQKSQEGLEIANHTTRISLTYTAQKALYAFSSSTRSTQRAWYCNIVDIYATRVVTSSVEEMGTTSKNNLKGITLRIIPLIFHQIFSLTVSISRIFFPTVGVRSTKLRKQ